MLRQFYFIAVLILFVGVHLSYSFGSKNDSLIAAGRVLRDQNQFDEAIKLFKQALKSYQTFGDSLEIAKTHNLLGNTFKRVGDKKAAIESYYAAIAINEKLNNYEALLFNYNGLANYYDEEGSYQKAYQYYKKAESFLRYVEDPKYRLVLKKNLSTVFSSLESPYYNYDSALFYNLQSLNLAQLTKDSLSISGVYHDLGLLYERNENLNAALPSYQQALDLKTVLGDSIGMTITLMGMGNIYFKLEKFEKSIEFYERSREIGAKVKYHKQELSLIFNLVKAKMATGKASELVEASALFQRYNSLRDSIFDTDRMQEVKNLETQYETAKKDEEIQQQEMAIRQKTFQSNLFLSFSILLVIMVVSTVFFFLQKQDYVKKLKNEEIANMRREQELKELNAMMHGQEEERNRIANDLHDRLGARLSSIKLLFQSEKSFDIKFKVLDSINEAIKETREISHNLSTDMLTRFGLETAIKDTVRGISDTGQIQVDFVSYGLQERLPLEVERNIYHVTLELINNTLKHANARNIMIQISCVDDEINVFYEDDGKGFDVKEVMDAGMGLRGMYARMNSINGVANVNSKPGSGLHVVLSIPLNTDIDSLMRIRKEKLA